LANFRITADVPNHLKDILVAELSSEDIAGIWENPLPDPEMTRMIVFVDSDSESTKYSSRIRHVFERHATPVPDLTVAVEGPVDWTLEWRKGFTNFPIGRTFRLVPSWEQPEVGDPREILRIDPGQAFGTGTHETTQMVLEALEDLDAVDSFDGRTVDIGTGSGILAIAVRKLGHVHVIGCDIDAEALRVAADNMARNQTDVGLFLGSADALASNSVSLALANLTQPVLLDIWPEIARMLSPSGCAILSGILDSQAEELRVAVTATGHDVQREMTRGEWVTFVVVGHGA
jgi:ribosomal protein L11 methyltransferase